MRSFRALAVTLTLTLLGACADAPTAVVPAPAAGLSAQSGGPGEINYSVTEYIDRWHVNFSTAQSGDIQSRVWSHSGGVGANPQGNNAYKYTVVRYKSSGPGCVVAYLKTTFVGGAVMWDISEVKLGGFTGLCPVDM
jgi:hypothetical protein